MDREEIKNILPHRDNMLLLDEVAKEDDVAIGHYTVRGDEFFLKGHFPGKHQKPPILSSRIPPVGEISRLPFSALCVPFHRLRFRQPAYTRPPFSSMPLLV